MRLAKKFEGKWVLKPTAALFRGMDSGGYWREDSPGLYDKYVNAHIEGTVMYASVTADSVTYDVVIEQKGRHALKAMCNCHMSVYMQDGWMCSHAVAALQYLADNFTKMTMDSHTREARIPYMLKGLTRKQAVDFLSDMMASEHAVYDAFIKKFGTPADADEYEADYGVLIDMMYYAAADYNDHIDQRLDFEQYFEAARNAGARGSARICRALSESIRDNMHMVDDSDGYYTDCMAESVAALAESVQSMPERKEHIKYFVGQMADAPKSMASHYLEALETVCIDDDDVECLDSALQSQLDSASKPEHLAGLARAQVLVLEGRDGDHSGRILEVLSDAYRLDADLRTMYVRRLVDGSSSGGGASAAAKKIIMRIIQEFPDDADTAVAALDALDPSDPAYHKAAMSLYASTGDSKHYDLLKRSDSWSASSAISRLLRLKDERKAVSICVNEGMHDRGVRILESKKSLALFDACTETLGRAYPAKYFEAYASMIRALAARKPPTGSKKLKSDASAIALMGRFGAPQSASDTRGELLRKHLLRIKTLGDKRYADLVDHVRSKSSENVSLLVALRDV